MLGLCRFGFVVIGYVGFCCFARVVGCVLMMAVGQMRVVGRTLAPSTLAGEERLKTYIPKLKYRD
jgi:hypothetical protein